MTLGALAFFRVAFHSAGRVCWGELWEELRLSSKRKEGVLLSVGWHGCAVVITVALTGVARPRARVV